MKSFGARVGIQATGSSVCGWLHQTGAGGTNQNGRMLKHCQVGRVLYNAVLKVNE